MDGRPVKYRKLVEKITGQGAGGHSKYKGELELAENQIRDFLQTKGYAGARGSMANVIPDANFQGVELATFDPTDIRIVNKWPSEEIPDVWLKKMKELW